MLDEITKQVAVIQRLADELAGVITAGTACKLIAGGASVLIRPEWIRQPSVADGPDPVFNLTYTDWLKLRDMPGFQDCYRENEPEAGKSKVFIHVGRATKFLERLADEQAELRRQPGYVPARTRASLKRWEKRRNSKIQIPSSKE